MTKRSVRVPANLQALASNGKRVRYNGFWLGESERDRVIADYIDRTPQIGAVIKAILYTMATGQGYLPVQVPTEHDPKLDDEIGAAGSALLDLDD